MLAVALSVRPGQLQITLACRNSLSILKSLSTARPLPSCLADIVVETTVKMPTLRMSSVHRLSQCHQAAISKQSFLAPGVWHIRRRPWHSFSAAVVGRWEAAREDEVNGNDCPMTKC